MKAASKSVKANISSAKSFWGKLTPAAFRSLKELTEAHCLSVALGDVLHVDGKWYISHSGLIRIAYRLKCAGIRVQPVTNFCDPDVGRWAFRATVYKTHCCKGFVGFGDADPSNVSPLVRSAEMRVAETRAVNRALRKAYGVGICSVEEIGSLRSEPQPNVRKLPPQPANGNGEPKLPRPALPANPPAPIGSPRGGNSTRPSSASGIPRQASRNQIAAFIKHLAELAAHDRDSLLCKLNSYQPKPQEGAA